MCRRRYLMELKQMLADKGQTDLLMTNEEINIRDKGKIIFRHMWAYYQKKKTHRIRVAASIKI